MIGLGEGWASEVGGNRAGSNENLLTRLAVIDSFYRMIRCRTSQAARDKLFSKLPVSADLLRGSLLDRIVRHTKDCPKCERGEGHRVFVLTVTYPGGHTRQFSVRREKVAEVRQCLDNYQRLKEAIERICELNHDILFESPRRRAKGLP